MKKISFQDFDNGDKVSVKGFALVTVEIEGGMLYGVLNLNTKKLHNKL